MNGWEWGKKMAVATRENIERQKDLDDDERIAEKVRVIMAILEDSKKHDSPLDAVRLIVNDHRILYPGASARKRHRPVIGTHRPSG